MRISFKWIAVLCGAMAGAAAGEATAAENEAAGRSLELVPAKLHLSGPRDGARALVAEAAAGERADVTDEAQFQIEPGGGVALGEDGYLVPLRNGEFRVKVTARGQRAELPVTVKGMEAPAPVSFLREVEPILSKVGCTAGACHGGAKGRNGFKLSLRGYDPEWDYRALTEDLAGRRANRVEPARSLMLLKPTQGVPHQGGLVVEEGSRYYRTLLDWISEGAQSDVGKVARVERLEVLPREARMQKPGSSQRFQVYAHYPDGSARDVTRDAIYSVNNITVAEISGDGRLTALRRGEAAVLVRYEGAYGLSNVTILGERPGFEWRPIPEQNYLDRLVNRKLERLKILPSALAGDADFIRRVSLDLIGVPPKPEEVRAFLAEPAADDAARRAKRERLVDVLMARPEFVDHWALKWGDLLKSNRKYLGEKGVWAFRNWIRQEVALNRPYDRFARELLTSTGSSFSNPAASYYLTAKEPEELMETTTQLFLGVRMMCAKCHDHPFEQWTQSDYYHLSAYFAKVGRKPGAKREESVIFEKSDGEVLHPKDGRIMDPSFPFANQRKTAVPASRRAQLADWLTSAQNPYFARAIANRLWSYFFGRGIIEPVDDIRASNPPSNPELLEALTEDFVHHGFDLQHLMRTIVCSRTYQLSVETNPFNADDQENFSHAVPRRLGAEQLRDAISVATGTLPKFPGVPADFRAEQLPDGKIAAGGFLDLFGRPPRESVCECERRSDVSLSQALNMVNGSTIADAVADPQGRVARLVKAFPEDGRLIEDLYLAALGRPPSEKESALAAESIRGAPSRGQGAEDLLWALLNSPAFLFNR